MISKKAIQQFLDRDLASYDFIKKYSEKELDEALNELSPVPTFHTKPWVYQKAVFLLFHELEQFMACLDLGLGKTKIILDLISYAKLCGENPKTIVFVPFISAIETWIDETSIHTPHLKCVPLIGKTDENLDTLFNEEGDLFVVQFQTATAMLTHDEVNPKTKKTKWNMNSAKVKKIFGDFDTLVIDESHKISNHRSLYYRISLAVSKVTPKIYLLTGTPFGTDPSYLWSQFYVMDKGETLGPTLGLFRGAFFTETTGHWGNYEYTFKKNMKSDLRRMIKNRSIRYRDSECEDIPKKKEIEHHIDIPPSTYKYYEKVHKELETLARHGKSKYKEIQSTFMQLMQLSSGFMTLKGQEDSTRVKLQFKENPKLDALMALIDTVPKDRKIVIFHFFTYSNEAISAALTKAKIKHSRVFGKTKDPISEIKKFKTEPDCRVLVINSKSGSSSLNLQVANYVFWYELPTSLIDFKQGMKRCWRRGQQRRVYFYFLLAKNTKDQRIYNYLMAGEEIFQAILSGKEKL